MAATLNPIVASFTSALLSGEGAPPYGGLNGSGLSLIPIGLSAGVGFPAKVDSVSLYLFRLGANYSGTTGIKVDIVVADDPSDTAAVVSKVSFWGVTIGPITSGTSTYDENASTGPLASCTEVTASVTMPATAGVLKTATIQVPIADMNSIAAGNWSILKIRRHAGSATDTDPGRVVLLAMEAYDY